MALLAFTVLTACSQLRRFDAGDLNALDVSVDVAGEPGLDASQVIAHDGGDVPSTLDARDETMPTDVVRHAGPDSNFVACPSAPTGPFAIERFSTGTADGHDLVFDGRGSLVVGGRQIVRADTTGMAMALTTDSDGLGINGIRYLPNGDLVFTATGGFLRGPGVRVMTGTTVRTIATEHSYSAPSGIAVDWHGVIYFTDTGSRGDGVLYRIGVGATTASVVVTGIGDLTGLALTPDGRKLYVASPSSSRIYELSLGPTGLVTSAPRVYVELVGVRGNGLAFDMCGNLYISDRDRFRVLRVDPGGGTFITIIDASSAVGDAMPARSPWGIAFGQGAGFNATHLYLSDATTGNVLRADVMIAGAPMTVPR